MPAVPITKVPDGMYPWCYQPPPLDLQSVEVWRAGWTDTHIISRDGDPRMNVYGLYWREPRMRAAELSHAIN